MQRLGVKIFLWFWMAGNAVGALFVISLVVSSPKDIQWADREIVAAEAIESVNILEWHGTEALKRHFDLMRMRPIRPYLLDERGREVLGQTPPPNAAQWARSLHGSGSKVMVSSDGSTSAQVLMALSGKPFTFLLVGPPITPWSVFSKGGINRLMLFCAVILVSAAFSFWMARYITAPVLQLRDAAQQIADGYLDTRISDRFQQRRDEIGMLAHHFDSMAQRIECLFLAQQRLLANVSHELRSPLSRLSVAAALLQDCPPGEQSECLQRIELEAEELSHLISQLLTLASAETIQSNPRKQGVDLVGVLQEVTADGDFEARAQNRRVLFNQFVPCTLSCAPEQIRTAIENVIRNAIRHTKDHTDVEVTLQRLTISSAECAVIKVRDHGPGVPDTDLRAIFEPFRRVASTQASDGSGLGLAITERFIEAHGGCALAFNASGGGLLVRMEIPLRRV